MAAAPPFEALASAISDRSFTEIRSAANFSRSSMPSATFPIYGELQGAIFFDAGNLLPTTEHLGLDDMRYAIGGGLRYKLPIGPIRLDYGVNPDPHRGEDQGAFHFSFGFAF